MQKENLRVGEGVSLFKAAVSLPSVSEKLVLIQALPASELRYGQQLCVKSFQYTFAG
jgi:hypothetical protein